MRWLGAVSAAFDSDVYYGWAGDTERPIGYQSGCCIMVRREVLDRLGGFDARFFYHFEETDLCRRIWNSGFAIMFYPGAKITHLGGQSVGRFPVRFALETYRSLYRYFHKHYGPKGVVHARWLSLAYVGVRYVAYSVRRRFDVSDGLKNRLAMYRVVLAWNWRLDPIDFVNAGIEPDLGYAPLAPAPTAAK
jgi:GT2 family glycosyltransferase